MMRNLLFSLLGFIADLLTIIAAIILYIIGGLCLLADKIDSRIAWQRVKRGSIL